MQVKTEVQVYDGDGTVRRESLNAAGWQALKTGDRLYQSGGFFGVVIKTYVTQRSGYRTPGMRMIQVASPHGRRSNIPETEWSEWSMVKPEHGFSFEDRMNGRPLTRETALKLKHGDVVYRRSASVAYKVISSGVFMGSTKTIKPDHRLKWEFERKTGNRFWVWQEELFAFTTDKPE